MREEKMSNNKIKYLYYDYVGRPARITLVENDIPDACEIYDRQQNKMVRDDTIMLDVLEYYGSQLISAAEFEALLKKIQHLPGEIK